VDQGTASARRHVRAAQPQFARSFTNLRPSRARARHTSARLAPPVPLHPAERVNVAPTERDLEGRAMPSNEGPGGIGNSPGGLARQGSNGVGPALRQVAAAALATAELVLTQLVGVPGTHACCQCLAAWWRNHMRHVRDGQPSRVPTHQAATATPPATSHPERS